MSVAIHQMSPEDHAELVELFENARCKDPVDVLLFIEQ